MLLHFLLYTIDLKLKCGKYYFYKYFFLQKFAFVKFTCNLCSTNLHTFVLP